MGPAFAVDAAEISNETAAATVEPSPIERPAPHVDTANRYIADVLAGRIPACKWVRAACQRQLDDLHRSQHDASFPWRFDLDAAERIEEFTELCPHIKGPLRGQLIHLDPWQCFIDTTIFGWLHKDTGKRRFREAYTEVPRGNGKSAWSSPKGLYLMALDDEGGAEVYSAATTRDQARIVFGVAQEMARAMPEFRDRFGVEVTAHSINQLSTSSWFRPLSSDANSLDGLNIHGAIIDEFHAHRTRDLYDVLKTAIGKRAQPLIWIITTAGSDRAGVCYADVRSYVTKILDGTVNDDRMFGIIYTIDDSDDWATEESCKKANPNWGVSVFADALLAGLHQAKQLASKQPAFQNKHLDVWTNTEFPWMDMRRLAACVDPNLSIDEFIGRACIIGLDLANKIDILASVSLFWRDPEGGGKRHYYAFGTYWLPEAQVEQAQNSQYRGWALDGIVRTCPGETNDYDLVEQHIREQGRQFDLREVAHDEWNAQSLVNHLQPEGITMVAIPQNVKHLSEPMKELEAAVYDRRFHYNGDPVLTWAFGNVRCRPDKNDNLFPTKERSADKIDPISALLNAISRGMVADQTAGDGNGPSVYGPCRHCGKYCEGTLVNNDMIFACSECRTKIVTEKVAALLKAKKPNA